MLAALIVCGVLSHRKLVAHFVLQDVDTSRGLVMDAWHQSGVWGLRGSNAVELWSKIRKLEYDRPLIQKQKQENH